MLGLGDGPALAEFNNADTDWMRDGKYGIYLKYLNWTPRDTTSAEYNRWVDSFDVDRFAETVELTGASWVIWGLGRVWFNSPNATLEGFVGDFTSNRDLPLEISNALQERGIRFMLYAAADKTESENDPLGKLALGWGLNNRYTSTYVNNWADVLQVWSDRYATKVSGWWIDHAYPRYAVSVTARGASNPEFAIYRDHLLSGNPDSIVAFNHGWRDLDAHTPEEDYRSGHERAIAESVASSRWWHGLQWHYLSRLGPGLWGSEGIRYDTQVLIDYVNENNRHEGANTFSVFVYSKPGESAEGIVKSPGNLSNAQIRQLSALRDASLQFVDDTSDDVTFVGTWERLDDELDFRGSTTGSDEADAHAELAFSGIGVEVVVRRGRNGGLVDVELDGDVVLDDFDTYSRTTAFKQVIYTNKNLDAGSHTVRLVATGRKSAAATAADAMLDNFAVTMADTMRPRVLSVTSDASHPTKDSFAVTIDFLEDVTGLRAGEISVSNGSVSNFAGSGASYTLDIAPTAGLEGEVTVDVPANAVVDGANNGNLEGSETFTVDTRAPVIQTAAANQAVLTLVYGEALDPLSVPPASAFTLTGGGAPRTISNIVVNGSRVVLSMDPPASYGEAGLQVGYSAPSRGAMADALGNKVPSFTNQAVANESPGTTPSADTWITGATAFSVREGDTAVATLTATQAATAAGDPVWWIPSGAVGGPDGGKFALSRAGVLTFAAAKDFEAPDDANADGSYQLTVHLSVGALTAAADLTVTLTDRNEAPVANARANQLIVAQGATVTLSGSGSDPDADDTLTYAWTQTGTPAVALSDTAVASPTFTAPSSLTEDITLSFTLRVADSSGLYHEDAVSVTVQKDPLLTAAFENAPARHDGSTPFAVDLRFSEEVALWFSAFTSGLLTTTGGTVQRASRLVLRSNIGWRIPVTPDGDGDVVITLSANRACSWLTGACARDGRKLAVGASVTVPGPAPGPAPDITSAAAFTVQEGETAVGTLTATDADTAAADLVWTIPSGTAGGADAGKFTLGRAGVLTFAAAKDFEDPDDANTDGSYQVTVQVSDGRLTDTADLSVTLTDRNEAPTANAGADQDNVAQGATVTLSGSGTDPDAGDVLSYAWTKTAGSAVTLSDADKATASFAVPSGLTADATFTFKLKVTDKAGLYNEDTVSVTVAGSQTASPQITSGSSFTVVEGDTAVATLTATDEDTATADLTWTLSGGADQAKFSLTSAGVMSFASAKDFEAPDDANTDGSYQVAVQVSDGANTDSADLTVTLANVNEAPTADAGADQDNVVQGATVTLAGTGTDPDDGDALTYAWTRTGGPSATLSDTAVAGPTFTAPDDLTQDAELAFRLRVSDTEGLYDEDSVTVTVTVRAGVSTGPAATLVVLNEDFDDGDVTAWTVYDGNWSVTEGAYGVNGGGDRKAVAAEVDVADFVLEAEVRVKSTSGDAGVVFRVNDPGTGTDNYKGYYVGVDSNSSLVFGKADAGRWQELDRVDLAFTLSRWYRLKVVASGSSIRVYVDEVLKIDATDGSYDRGAIGLRTWRAEADWDNVTVSKIVEEDSVGFRVSAADAQIDEGGASTVTVATANGETFAEAQRIALSVSGSASTADYELASTGLTLAAGSAAVSVVLTAVDDEAEEAAETVTVTAARNGSEIGSATVTIRASDEPEVEDPAAPEIGARTSFTVAEGTTAVGTLTATDADTAAAALTWSILSGADAGKLTLTPRGVLAFAAAKDYEAPDDTGTDGAYQVTVQVSDGGRTDTADLTVTLANVNERPVADAGPDRIGVPQGEAVTLSGSGADPDAGDTLTYAWTKTAGSAAALSNADTATATFAAPTGLTSDTTFKFKLKVTDGGGLSGEDTVTVTVAGRTAAPDITSASSFTVREGDTAVATLSATDTDTGARDLTWSLTGGADRAKFAITSAGALSFAVAKDYEAPDDLNTDGAYQVTVQVSDGANTDSGDLTVTLANVNEAPTAGAGDDQTSVVQDSTVTLAGSGMDPDADDTLSYAWTKTAGRAVTLNNAETETATFTAPSGLTTDAAFTFKLKVTDAGGLFHEDSVAVTVKGLDPAVTVAAGTSPVTEGTAATFTVSLDKDATESLSVTVTVTESESMLSGTPPTSVAFAVGDRTKTVAAATADDAVIETDSTVTAALGPGSDYTLGTSSSAEVTVEDDDTATWQVSAAEASIDEGDATTLTVAVANGKTFAEEQSIALTVSGTAAESDYSLTSSPLALAAGSSSVTATLTAADDTDDESAETVRVAASHGGSSIGSVTVTIRANDVPLARVTGVTVTELVESLSVTWTAVVGADGYRVQWREDGEAYEATRQHTVAGGLTSQTIEGLAADTSYWLRVAATKAGADDGPWSAGASGTPRASEAGRVDGDLRLVGGEEDHEGRVEVYHDGEWGTVCDDYWGIADARVACRQLGFANANEAPRRARFGEGGGPIWMDNVDCTGAETALADCQFRGWGVHNCRHREDAGAVCATGVDEGASAAGLRDARVGAREFGPSAEGPAGTVPAHDDSVSIEEAIETALGGNPASDLEVLDLTDRKLGNLAGVERLTGLRVLRLRGNAVADISPLAGLHGLRELDLSDNAVVDLWPLAGLSNIGNLDLSDNAVSDLSPLVGLERLSALSLDDNAVADLSPLAQLPGLARLRLSRNRIGDLSPLYGLRGLRELVLSGNAVVELWPLAQLSGLERLYLAGNVIEDPGPLAGLSSVQVLDLARNRIETVHGLARLDRVQTLKLDRNRLSVLYGLAGLESVQALSLRGNAVEDVYPLAPLANLRWLDLRENPVSDLAPLAERPVVVWLDGTAGRDRGQPPRRVILAPVEPVPDQPEL